MANKIVLGLDQLSAQLQELAKVAEPSEQRAALMAGGVPIRNEARRLVPKRSMQLHDSITVRPSDRRQQKRYGAAVLVGPKGGREGAPYAHLVEFGTKPHTIKPPKGKLLRIMGRFFRLGVRHPGARAQPYMRPAFDTKRGEALNIIERELWARVQKRIGK
ncbi:MAG TPA: HK97 gp10 family phage protein [Caldilineaceae bacterium]|nr:HK97 gp10 family phage protein [Caldilineaceae bacterium]